MQNGYIERFNSKFKDERLNEHWSQTLHQARAEIDAWRGDYNKVSPPPPPPPNRWYGERRQITSMGLPFDAPCWVGKPSEFTPRSTPAHDLK
jgi:hypothetical protein